MSNMAAVIVPKSDQINSDDLIAGPMTITITGVKVQGGQEQPVSISIEGSPKFYRPCKSMSRVLVAAWGADANAYTGRSLTLYRDPTVKWGGMAVGGIRISHMTDLAQDLTLMLTMTKQNRAPHTVKVLRGIAPAPAPSAATLTEARAAAAKGTATFKAWWAANADLRADAKTIMQELKATCDAADAAGREADPFGLPPLPADEDATRATDTEVQAHLAAEHAAFEAARAAEEARMEGGDA